MTNPHFNELKKHPLMSRAGRPPKLASEKRKGITVTLSPADLIKARSLPRGALGEILSNALTKIKTL